MAFTSQSRSFAPHAAGRSGRNIDDDEKYKKRRLQQEQKLKLFFAGIVLVLFLSIVGVWFLRSGRSPHRRSSPSGDMLKSLLRQGSYHKDPEKLFLDRRPVQKFKDYIVNKKKLPQSEEAMARKPEGGIGLIQ